MYFPDFKSEFLEGIVFSLKKRHKSLKHRINKIVCDKVYDIIDGQRIEKCELTLHESKSPKGVILRIYIWEDRWVWIDARKCGKSGWNWEWTLEGRVPGSYISRNLVTAIEESYTISLLSDQEILLSEMSKTWEPLLAGKLISVK